MHIDYECLGKYNYHVYWQLFMLFGSKLAEISLHLQYTAAPGLHLHLPDGHDVSVGQHHQGGA